MLFKVNDHVYKVISHIASGSHGRVFKVEDDKGEVYAAKIPNFYSDDVYEDMLNDSIQFNVPPPPRTAYQEILDEIETVSTIDKKVISGHPNIARFIESAEVEVLSRFTEIPDDEPVYVIVQEYIEGSIKPDTFNFELECLPLMTDILSAFLAFDEVGFVYYDLHLDNIGYDEKKDRYVLYDYGDITGKENVFTKDNVYLQRIMLLCHQYYTETGKEINDFFTTTLMKTLFDGSLDLSNLEKGIENIPSISNNIGNTITDTLKFISSLFDYDFYFTGSENIYHYYKGEMKEIMKK